VTVRLNPYLSFRDSAREAMTFYFEKAPWGDTFGMCVDRFGTSWMVNATA
jgi:PhnB protein